MRQRALAAAAVLLLAASACTPKRPATTPVVVTPRFPEYAVPAVPAELAGSPAAAALDRAWAFLQNADFRSADRELAAATKADPQFYPADAAAGYVDLARKDG